MDGYKLLYLLLAVGVPFLIWRLLKRRGTRLGGLGLRGRMRIVRPRGGQRLAFRRWSWHPILGLLVVLAALAVGVWQPEWLGIPLAVAALIPAALFALPRQGIVIDRQRAAVKRWWGLLVPMISTRIEHVTFHAVIITGEKRATLFREWNVHEVSLSIPGEASAVIETDCTPDRAWELAMALARFLEVPLMDYVAESSVTLMPRTLAASLRERVAQGRVTLALPDAPPRAHARQTVSEESLAFAIRPAGVWLRRLCALALAAGVPAAVLLLTDQLAVLRAYDAVWALAALCVGACIIAWRWLPPVPLGGWQVTASPEELRVRQRGLLARKTHTLRADDVRELVVVSGRSLERRWFPSWFAGKGRAVIARGPEATVSFGWGLSAAEAEWIKASLEVALNA